jgi:hypothetical protein
MKNTFFIILFFLLMPLYLSACTMEPSLWDTLEIVDGESDPGVFALTDALYQLHKKMFDDLSACGIPVLPITVVAAFQGDDQAVMSDTALKSLEHAMQIAWQDATLLSASELVKSPEDFIALEKAGKKVGDRSYSAMIKVAGARSASINQIDLNFWLYQLYRCVLREEIRVFIRIADSSGTALFIDEITVSPTVIVDPMISPVGGFIIRFEKNTARPLLVDFGPLVDGGEHVIRLNDAYRQPSSVPPMPEFSRPRSSAVGTDSSILE